MDEIYTTYRENIHSAHEPALRIKPPALDLFMKRKTTVKPTVNMGYGISKFWDKTKHEGSCSVSSVFKSKWGLFTISSIKKCTVNLVIMTRNGNGLLNSFNGTTGYI